MKICRAWNSGTPEAHKITLLYRNGYAEFIGENSLAGTLYIDKIRVTTDSTKAYIDIHYNGGVANQVGFYFDPYPNDPATREDFTATNFVPKGDSPSGETIVATHNFASSTITDISSTFTMNTTGITGLTGFVNATYNAQSKLVDLDFAVYTVSSGVSFGTNVQVATCGDYKYFPSGDVYGSGMVCNSSGVYYPYRVKMDNTGKIYQMQTGSATRVYGHITYKI